MQDKNKTIIIILSVVVVILAIALLVKGNDEAEMMPVDTNATTTVSGTTSVSTPTVKPTTGATTPKPAAVNTEATVLPAQFVMMVGNTYTLPEGSIITLKDVSDSRCPTDENIRCVWAGNVTASMNIKKGGYTKDITLSMPGATYTHSGYKISLDSVAPAKGLQSVVIKKEEYKLTFTVSK